MISTKTCTIVIDRQTDGSYRAWVPTLPDAIAVANTPDAARRQVTVALAEHLKLRTTAAPTPSPLPGSSL